MMIPALLSLVSLLSASSNDRPDLVVLQDGKEIECRVLFEDETRVVYKTSGREKEVERSEVAEVHSIETNMRSFLERYEVLPEGDIRALGDLATWAESVDLAGEARGLWIRILLLDPENERAWTKLGGSQGRKGWRLKVRGRFKTLEELRERVAEWKTAMELPTAHYLIRTNIDPTQALDLAIEAERIHERYYDTLGKAMGLYPFGEVPELHIHADSEEAPSPPAPGWEAWFERGSNTLVVRGMEANRHAIRKAFVDLLMYNSSLQALGNHDGVLPAWTREGLGHVFGFYLEATRNGRQDVVVGPHRPWLSAQAADEDPLTVKQIVNAGRGAFEGGGAQDAYVRQGYTLCYFLIHGQGGDHRDGFVRYLQIAFTGKAAVKHLEECLGVDAEELDEQWTAWVKQGG